MGTTRDDGSQQSMWVATADLPQGGGHPFYERLNQILSTSGFDAFVEDLCAGFYARMGRPSLAPGRYFQLLLVGYFEGLDSERAIAWRSADSLSLRSFLRLAPPASPPDHSTISRTRRLLSLETHEAVFTWVLQQLADAGLVRGKTVGVDATTLEANAALRSIVRRDTGEDYTAFLTRLAEASGIATPTRAELARFDKSRKKRKKTSNGDWTHPHDPDARVTKMKDGRTHLAHKAEHAVDMETGAVVGVTVQAADTGDTTSMVETLIVAAEQVEAAASATWRPRPPRHRLRAGRAPRRPRMAAADRWQRPTNGGQQGRAGWCRRLAELRLIRIAWSQWSASNSPGRHDTRSNRSLRTPHNGSAARRTSRSDDATVPRRNRTARRWRPRGQRDARLHLQHNGGAANWCRDTDALRQQAHRGRRGRRTHWHGSAEVRSSRHSIRALPTVGHVREYTLPHPRKAPRNSSDKWTGCRRLEEPLQASVFRFVETCLTARVRRHGE